MSKSLDRVLQPDGSYKWQEIELIHSGKLIEPVVEPEPEEIVVTEEPVVKQTNDFESMTKKQLEELEEKLNPST
jgi:hypothetical protein